MNTSSPEALFESIIAEMERSGGRSDVRSAEGAFSFRDSRSADCATGCLEVAVYVNDGHECEEDCPRSCWCCAGVGCWRCQRNTTVMPLGSHAALRAFVGVRFGEMTRS